MDLDEVYCQECSYAEFEDAEIREDWIGGEVSIYYVVCPNCGNLIDL